MRGLTAEWRHGAARRVGAVGAEELIFQPLLEVCHVSLRKERERERERERVERRVEGGCVRITTLTTYNAHPFPHTTKKQVHSPFSCLPRTLPTS